MSAHPHLNIFVICSMTKRFLGTGNLLLRNLGGSSISERFSFWSYYVQQSRSPSFPAIDTYSGGYWSVVRSINISLLKRPATARLWIVSAGYGLISPADEIIPYGATFAAGQPDSISSVSMTQFPGSAAEWWRLLSLWRPPCVQPDAPRSVTDVISRDPDASNVLVLSPDYFRALRDDLCQALKIISDQQKLIILTSDDRSHGELVDNTIRIDARLQAYLGGARSSLGIRTAQSVLKKLDGKPVTVDSFRAATASLVDRHGIVQVYDRQPMTNKQVLQFIKKELCCNTSLSSTAMLTKLRSSGRACERKRFQKLFAAVKEQRAASLCVPNAESD